MKKAFNIFFIVVGILIFLLFVIRSWTKSHSPFEKVELKKSDFVVNVGYCRPKTKGRKIFGELIPYGTVWRTGANEATEINFSKSVEFGGKKVKAGAYSLWTIPGKEEWILILNKETGQWGTNYDEAKDYIRIKVKPIENETLVEQLTFSFSTNNENTFMVIQWEKVRIEIPIQE